MALLPAVAQAGGSGIPDYPYSTIGSVINLGGMNGTIVDALATKTVSIRDAFNSPVEGATVVLTFTSCTNQDIRLCAVQPQHPGAFFNCVAKTVTALTDANGIATFRVAGYATNSGGNSPGVGPGCASVQANGIPLGNLTVGTPDQNGIGGIDVADLSGFANDRFGAYRGRSDFNGDHVITVADLGLFATFRFGQGSTVSCAAACP